MPVVVYEGSTLIEAGASLADQVIMLGLGKNYSVQDLLTTKSDVFCYKYAMDL